MKGAHPESRKAETVDPRHSSSERPPLYAKLPISLVSTSNLQQPEDSLRGAGTAVMDSEDEEEKKEPESFGEYDPRRYTCDRHDKEDEEEADEGPADYATVGVDRNVLKNGGVKKTVVKHSPDDSPQTPLYGDEVTGQRFSSF